MRKLDFLTYNLIAHRGIHYRYIENTIDAFRSAMIRGYIIELDIRLTKDNVVVVMHDNNLLRITGVNKNISESTYQELLEIIDIPTLEEVLELVNGKVPIIIEFKIDDELGKLESIASKILDSYKGDFAVQSFNPLSLLWFKLNRKNYIRGYLVNSVIPNNFFMKLLLNKNLLNVVLRPDYIGVNIKFITNKKIVRLRNKYMIIGYTINKNDEYNKYKKYGDNFICNIGKEPYF